MEFNRSGFVAEFRHEYGTGGDNYVLLVVYVCVQPVIFSGHDFGRMGYVEALSQEDQFCSRLSFKTFKADA